MHPLIFLETQGFELEGAMVSGLLPPHFLSPDPIRDLRSYAADYLKEEIAAEGAVQSIPAFSEFLRVAALTSGELLNYTNVAREAGVSAKVVRSYFQILEDTLLGLRVASWRKSKTRRMIETEKFYLFDVGVANYLSRRTPHEGTPEFGKAFEHYILMELKAYQAYRNPEMDIRYWRTSTGMEVDFILGEMDVALEIKGARRVHEGDLKGLTALLTDHKVKHPLLISLEREPRKIGTKVRALPWEVFLRELWSGALGV
jgi:predicted AAA+ superfamily ATPase